MRWLLYSFTASVVLLGSFSETAIAFDKTEIETQDLYAYVTTDAPDYESAPLTGATDFNLYKLLYRYEYPVQQRVAMHYDEIAEARYEASHTGAFGGTLDFPTRNTTASATIPNITFTCDSPIRGTSYTVDNHNTTYFFNYPDTTGNYGTIEFETGAKTIPITLSQGSFSVSAKNLKYNETETGTTTTTGDSDGTGTIDVDAQAVRDYYVLKGDWQARTKYYIYLFSRVQTGAPGRYPKGQSFQWTINSSYDTYKDEPLELVGRYGANAVFVRQTSTNFSYYTDMTDALSVHSYDTSAYTYLGIILNITPSKTCDKLLIRPPRLYMIDETTEQTIEYETQQQTDTMMSTEGSGGVLSGQTQQYIDVENKLGFVGQSQQAITGLWDAAMNTSEASYGRVTFPGISWEGQEILPMEYVPIVPEGFSLDVVNKIKHFNTFVLFLFWLKGMKSILGRIFGLEGEPVEVDTE